MGSKGHIPPHLRRSLPGPGMMLPDPFGPRIRHPPGGFPFDRLPPPELLEQKLAAQYVEMEQLAMENQRIAATHATLRQELAATQQELQRLQGHIGAMNFDKKQQMRGLLSKLAMMEDGLLTAEPIKLELQQARADSENLIAVRQQLISKVQQLSQDLQRSHADVQQVPAMISELDGLRQEYQHCRATYDYEKKLYDNHLESLQVMEKNYVSLAREVEKLRAELANTGNLERRSGGSYAGASVYKENDAGHPLVGQSAYEDGYGVPQGHGAIPGGAAAYSGGPPGPAPARAGYDAPRGPSYDAPKEPGYDAPRGSSYDAPPRVSGYDALPRGFGGYEAPARAGVGQQAPVASGNGAPYGSSLTPTHAVEGGYDAPPRGGNTIRR